MMEELKKERKLTFLLSLTIFFFVLNIKRDFKEKGGKFLVILYKEFSYLFFLQSYKQRDEMNYVKREIYIYLK